MGGIIIDIRNLITFKKIVELNSFTKAATELQYSQSTITSHIKLIEEELSSPIFDRFGKKFILNDIGKELYVHTLKLLEIYEQIVNIPKDTKEIRGVIKIGAAETVTVYRLQPILREMKRSYPNLRISLVNDHCVNLREKIYNGSIDVAITLEPEVKDDNLVVTPLKVEPIVFIGSNDNPVNEVKKINNDELCIILTQQGCSLRKSFEAHLGKLGINTYTSLEFSNMEAIKQCVASNLGISVAPLISVKKLIDDKHLKIIDSGLEFEKQYTQLIYHRNKWISPPISKFIELTMRTSI